MLLAALVLSAALWSREGRPVAGVFRSHDESRVASGELIVHFRPGLPESQRQAVLAAQGATIERDLLLAGYATVTVPAGHERQVGEALAANWAVQAAEESPLRQPSVATDLAPPDDPYFTFQWNMKGEVMNQQQKLASVGINVQPAWEIADGSGVVVAVIDTGVAFEDYVDPLTSVAYGLAPDLVGTTFVYPHDFFAGDDHPNDDFGHGTHVTGTIAQATNNGIGVAGIAPKAAIMPIKVCGHIDSAPSQYGCPPADIADGIVWAVDHGAEVINLSLGSPDSASQAEEQAVEYAVNHQVVVIAAAGNGGSDLVGDPHLDFPAGLPSVISVGGAGLKGDAAGYSNYSSALTLVAPGGDPAQDTYILQNSYGVPCAAPANFTSFAYCYRYGTSMAAAHVSGVAALILAKYPTFKPPKVKLLLTACARDVGPPGRDDADGAGLLQAYDSLKDVNPDGKPDGIPDGLQDVDRDGFTDCVDPRVETPPPPPTNTCDSPIPTSALASGVQPDRAPEDAGTPTDTPISSSTDTPAPGTGTGTPTGTATATPAASPSETPGNSTPTQTATPEPTPTPTPTPRPSYWPQQFACGDVTCDGAVDAFDAVELLRWEARVRPWAPCLGNGYLTCGANVGRADALVILRKEAGLPLDVPSGCRGAS